MTTQPFEPTPDLNVTYSFCEPSWATSYGREHIRALDATGRQTSGGIKTPALCGMNLMFGWDNEGDVTRPSVSGGLPADAHNRVCPKCAAEWSARTGTLIAVG